MPRSLLFAALFALSACATLSAPATGTFQEEKIGTNRYRIAYMASPGESRQSIADKVLARAAQATLDAGQQWFEIASRIDAEHARTLVIVMGSGETLAGGASKTYDARQTLNAVKAKRTS